MGEPDPGEAAEILESLNRALDDGLDRAQLLEIGHAATTLIVARTKHGIDAGGQQFRSYSPSYTKVRQRKALSTTRDLAVTGHMLSSIVPTVTGKNEVTIGFLNEQEANKATWQNFGTRRGVPASEFMDIREEKELDALAEMVGLGYAFKVEKKLDR